MTGRVAISKSPGRLSGKVALVTGGATGIGRGIVSALAEDGATVVVNYLDNPSVANDVVAEVESAGGQARAVQADVGDRREYGAMVDRVIGSLGRWDILVNNAAIALVKPFDTITESEFDLSFRVNVKGVFHGCQLAWRHLSEGGRIINLSSATTGLMLPGYGVYDATKGAVEQLTRILAKELGPRKITVNTVSPGATDTPNYRVGKSDEQIESQIAHNAIGRLGTVDDVAPVVAFLATDGARWVTGQNIRVNGGSS